MSTFCSCSARWIMRRRSSSFSLSRNILYISTLTRIFLLLFLSTTLLLLLPRCCSCYTHTYIYAHTHTRTHKHTNSLHILHFSPYTQTQPSSPLPRSGDLINIIYSYFLSIFSISLLFIIFETTNKLNRESFYHSNFNCVCVCVFSFAAFFLKGWGKENFKYIYIIHTHRTRISVLLFKYSDL